MHQPESLQRIEVEYEKACVMSSREKIIEPYSEHQPELFVEEFQLQEDRVIFVLALQDHHV